MDERFLFVLRQACPERSRRAQGDRISVYRLRREPFVLSLSKHVDAAAATQSDRHQIRHAEVGAHPANLYRQCRLARKTFLQDTDVSSGAADVDYDRVTELTQVCRAADAVRRPGSDGEDGIA